MNSISLILTYPSSDDFHKETDFFDLSWFFDAADGLKTHVVHGYRYGTTKGQAKCRIRMVQPDCFDLIYKESDVNSDNKNMLGTLRVHFSNSSLEKVTQVEWKDEKGGKFEAKDFAFSIVGIDDSESLEGTPEGQRKVGAHLAAERISRKQGAIQRKKSTVHAETGKLCCETCGFDFLEKYGELGTGFCEVHHLFPLHKGERETKNEDLAVLCSNCHRMIHRYLSKKETKGKTDLKIYTLESFIQYANLRPPKAKAG